MCVGVGDANEAAENGCILCRDEINYRSGCARGQTRKKAAARATCEVTMNCASNLLLCFNNRGVLAAGRGESVQIFYCCCVRPHVARRHFGIIEKFAFIKHILNGSHKSKFLESADD